MKYWLISLIMKSDRYILFALKFAMFYEYTILARHENKSRNNRLW